jgi:hypothetical protein
MMADRDATKMNGLRDGIVHELSSKATGTN